MDIAAVAALAPVIPVLTIEKTADAVPLARALVKGGLPVLEITLRTRAAIDALKAIAADVPDAVVGAGTVLRSTTRSGSARGCSLRRQSRLHAGSGARDREFGHAVPARRADRIRRFGVGGTGVPFTEILPGRHRWWTGLVKGHRGANAGNPVLPNRRHQPGECAELSRLAECGLHRRILGGASCHRSGGAMGRDREAGGCGCSTQTEVATPLSTARTSARRGMGVTAP